MKLKYSITFYPQINNQTKKMNQTLKQILQHYVNCDMNN